MSDERDFAQLRALAEHKKDIGIHVTEGSCYKRVTTSQSAWSVDISKDDSCGNMVYLVGPTETELYFFCEDIDAMIALLTRARQILQGGA